MLAFDPVSARTEYRGPSAFDLTEAAPKRKAAEKPVASDQWVDLQPGVVYRLAAKNAPETMVHLRFEADGDIRYIGLPIDEVATFDMTTTRPVRLCVAESVDFRIAAKGLAGAVVSNWLALTARDVLRLTDPRGVSLYPRPDGKKRAKAFRRALKIYRALDISPERGYAPADSHMVTGKVSAQAPIASRRSTARLAVVLHLYYADLWPEIAGYLTRFPRPFALIVSLTETNPGLVKAMRRHVPDVEFHVTGNFGRDLGPFFALLDQGVLDRFDYVCKLHGKKSVRHGRASALGDLWRRRYIAELIGGDQVNAIVAQFDADPALGIVGPSAFRVPNARLAHHDAWGNNRDMTLALAEHISDGRIDATSFQLDFFSGSMFWFRPAAFASMRRMGFGQPMSYAAEAAMTDGALEHAVERLMSFGVTQSGFEIGETPPVTA